MRTLASWCVHAYTASSAVFGVWSILAIFQQEYRLAIYLMMLTLVIDSTDGALARWADVRGTIPWFDGRRLDDICDFFTYVLVPACFLVETGLLPHPAWAAVPVLASCYGFSRDDAKTPDHFFTGWPSYWNVVVMYFYLMDVGPQTALWITLVLSAAIFVPLRYIYPSRTRVLRPLSLTVLGLWVLGFSWIAVRPDPSPVLLWLSLLGPGYYFALSMALNLRRPPPPEPA
ncbi:MAG: CDP-diacylglycerol O-phosphatidyltransferase [Deltaproteobacteria bacterium]|nr:CDP-diacylglycerol O-phosphatidyltransferase [Deltaproteobacteria bacterium]MBW2415406.1 CDP-diacylglycerol O-phosphatidyltransferase [Deltaproteobacteria bacterium]